jgi:hypothetical protein
VVVVVGRKGLIGIVVGFSRVLKAAADWLDFGF